MYLLMATHSDQEGLYNWHTGKEPQKQVAAAKVWRPWYLPNISPRFWYATRTEERSGTVECKSEPEGRDHRAEGRHCGKAPWLANYWPTS